MASGTAPGALDADPVSDKLEIARRELLDLGLRNALLNFRPSRARGVEVVDELPAEVFRLLVRESKSMAFLPAREAEADSAGMPEVGAEPDGAAEPEQQAGPSQAALPLATTAPVEGAIAQPPGESTQPADLDGVETSVMQVSVDSSIEAESGDGGAVPIPADSPSPEAASAVATTPEPEPADARLTDLRLQTALSEAQLQKRLLATYYDARTIIEEQGVNILFLALGMLQWFEGEHSQEPRRAPLILIPVELERSSARDRFRLRAAADEIGENLSLRAKLLADFGIAPPDFPELEDLDVEAYFSAFQEAIVTQPRWSIDRRAIALGFFSFGKFLMYHDLDTEEWPAAIHPAQHSTLRALLTDGFDSPERWNPDDAEIDHLVTPSTSRQVLDADSSQTLALLDAAAGHNLVIQGPPGTGKSQTITNLIAEAIGAGKTVLFVAEKLAALEVVKRRLDQVGLGDACLELHSHKTNKRAVLQELRRTLELGQPRVAELAGRITQLEDDLARLNAYCDAVNTPIGESGVTPYQALGELVHVRALPGSDGWPRLDLPELGDWSADEFARRLALVEELQARVAAMGVPAEHPFWGCQRTTLLPSEQDRLRVALDEASEALNSLRHAVGPVAETLGMAEPVNAREATRLSRAADRALEAPQVEGIKWSSPEWLSRADDVRALVVAGTRYAEIRKVHDTDLIPEAWQQDLLPLRQRLAAHADHWYRFVSGDYRRARAELRGYCRGEPPKDPKDQLQLVDDVLEARRQAERINDTDLSALAGRLFGSQWRAERADWLPLSAWAEWIITTQQEVAAGELPKEVLDYLDAPKEATNLLEDAAALTQALSEDRERLDALLSFLEFDPNQRADTRDGLDPQLFEQQAAMLDSWAMHLDDFDQMVAFNVSDGACREAGLGRVIEIAERWPEAGKLLTTLFQRARATALIERALKEQPALTYFDGSAHEQVIARFRQADQAALQLNRARLAHEHWRRLPRHEGGGQLAALRREFEKKTRFMPIRRLMERAGHAVQAIKPVFMMSPLSVAAFLPPGSVSFDLVVFDEASQVQPVDAFGAILRGAQTVVVGDSKQLPPTSFFDALTRGEEIDSESTTDDIESILGLMTAQNVPFRMLRWHYRSRHESLIAVSNAEFYDHHLVVFPSPDATREAAGLRLHHLPQTVYDRGNSRTNAEEARIVAEAVMQHAQEHPELTLGVAAFSAAQAGAIRDRLELLRRADPRCEGFFAAHPHEPFFVKNLENVQGDERDVIFISIGYGRTAEGYVAMNFGPLNGDGGERRLNVLITRARLRCEVFTNLTSDDLDLERTNARGVRALKHFLKYAETGNLDLPVASGRPPESPFEEAVLAALTGAGYEVQPQVGSGGFFIDLAVVDPRRPGHYLLGIECDGATYHSARSARDRDRLRQQVLEGLGWHIYRIWSTDWFKHPERELARLIAAIDEAKAAGDETVIPTSETQPTAIERLEPTQEAEPGPHANELVPYVMANPDVSAAGRDLYLIPTYRLAGSIVSVVQVESPVHADEVVRRIADAAGISRVGNRIRAALDRAIEQAVTSGQVRRQGDFLWSNDMATPPLRDRSALKGAGRAIEYIAPEELALAVLKVVGDGYGMKREQVPTAVCRLLGFQRVTAEMRAAVEPVVAQMLADGRLQVQGESVIV